MAEAPINSTAAAPTRRQARVRCDGAGGGIAISVGSAGPGSAAAAGSLAPGSPCGCGTVRVRRGRRGIGRTIRQVRLGRHGALADRREERLGLELGLDAELVAEQGFEILVGLERLAAPILLDAGRHQQPAGRFVEAVEGDQPPRRCFHLAKAPRVLMLLGQSGERAGRQGSQALPFLGQPGLEPGIGRAPAIEQIALIECCGGLQVRRVAARRRCESRDVAPQVFAGQGDPARVAAEGLRFERREALSETVERLAQGAPCLLVLAVAPEQRRQLLARMALVRRHGEIGQQQRTVPRREVEQLTVQARFESAQQSDLQPRHGLIVPSSVGMYRIAAGRPLYQRKTAWFGRGRRRGRSPVREVLDPMFDPVRKSGRPIAVGLDSATVPGALSG